MVADYVDCNRANEEREEEKEDSLKKKVICDHTHGSGQGRQHVVLDQQLAQARNAANVGGEFSQVVVTRDKLCVGIEREGKVAESERKKECARVCARVSRQ